MRNAHRTLWANKSGPVVVAGVNFGLGVEI
jgi:superfamily II DNA helicase RecQ